jgi:formylglycine-generating enzyme required for sulfatase activity
LVACALVALAALGCSAESKPPDATSTVAKSSSAPPATAASTRASATPACPPEMARVERFCIDRYEAHLVDANDPEHPRDPYHRPPPDAHVVARSRAGVVPQAYLNRFEAAAACGAAGKRLCAAAEWSRACAGPRGLRYPYGNTKIEGRCNVGKGHVMHKVFGDVRYTFDDHYNSPKLNQEPGFLEPSGASSGCESAEGVHDLVGNLHEWVADDVSADLLRRIPFELGADKLGTPGNGIFMGGYYSSHGEHGAGCAYATTAHKPDYHDYSIGFRCCADAPSQ